MGKKEYNNSDIIFCGVMNKITINELVEYKIVPFNIYDENGDIVVNAGDNLTPGKLLQLRYIANLYCDNVQSEDTDSENEETDETKVQTDYSNQQPILEIEEDSLDNVVNTNSIIGNQTQLQLKAMFKKAYTAINTKINGENIKQIKITRDKILDSILPIINKAHKKSQLKIIGNYEKYHGLNVAILAVMLAKKMNLSDVQIADLTLAALLHDIGKSRLPKEYHSAYSSNSATQSNMMYELHPEIGYKILKNEMKMPENICVVALEHHEKNDGSGYPHGVSSDLIHKNSQIVAVCNMYDNLISGKANVTVNTPQEAVRKILEMGTSWFAPEVLFSFVHMTTYHDDISLEKLGETGTQNW